MLKWHEVKHSRWWSQQWGTVTARETRCLCSRMANWMHPQCLPTRHNAHLLHRCQQCHMLLMAPRRLYATPILPSHNWDCALPHLHGISNGNQLNSAKLSQSITFSTCHCTSSYTRLQWALLYLVASGSSTDGNCRAKQQCCHGNKHFCWHICHTDMFTGRIVANLCQN